MHPKGTSFRAPAVTFFARLDLGQNPSFLDEHYLAFRLEIVIWNLFGIWYLKFVAFHRIGLEPVQGHGTTED